MNYATTANRPNPLAVVGALGVPATVGAILVAGLAVKIVIAPPVPNPKATDVPDVVITPEIFEVEKTDEINPRTNPAPRPDTPRPAPAPDPAVTFTGSGPLTTGGTLTEDWGTGLDAVELPEVFAPAPIFDPVAASPRGNPRNWISTSDYRTSWIRRGYEGNARFTLKVNASGKVTDCTVTGSTGYEALDRATCQLISSRAVFNPAKDERGASVAGTYSSVVNWRIPE
ncbi:TonB family protein [Erythrobacter sp. SCSIO 43205]|uniref:energy transducer TonB n=1 Tax=Erythrobacter sp. SCSIO 43205 TaxID=2779361 RepID=UPI001CA86209|nr:energy transducer TonB [Erythrobacter sp. SCSIO 43205]UAB79413.1 TonB family protein [Erythrobacter sp. SCSIO 43205]